MADLAVVNLFVIKGKERGPLMPPCGQLHSPNFLLLHQTALLSTPSHPAFFFPATEGIAPISLYNRGDIWRQLEKLLVKVRVK